MELAFYPSITDIVEVMKTLIRARHSHSDSFITDKVPRRTQGNEIYQAKEEFDLAMFSVNLGHVFGRNVALNLKFC